jgi:uncharacterized membrane protein YqjE
MADETERTGGLLASLRNLARTFLAILQNRLELVASDIDEARARLARIAVLAAVAAFCLGLALILLVLFLLVLFWDSDRLLAIGVLGGVFAAGAIAAGLMLRAEIRRRRFLSATLAELRKDRTKIEGQ